MSRNIGIRSIQHNGVPWIDSGRSLSYLANGHWVKSNYATCGINTLPLRTFKGEQEHYPIYGAVSVYFLDQATGWVTFHNGHIAKTVDGGKSWCDFALVDKSEPSDALPFWLDQVTFVDAKNGIAEGSGRLYSTADGGINWIKIPSDQHFNDITERDGSIWAASELNLYSVTFQPSEAIDPGTP